MPTVDELPEASRLALAEQFVEQMVIRTYRELSAWGQLTGQTAQVDSGYLGQHLVSLVSGEMGRGEGGRGKGDDLVGGAEVKVASTLGGVDTPRWNHLVGVSDEDRALSVPRLLAHPTLYYVLLDTPERSAGGPLRTRIWRVNPGTDQLFRDAVLAWGDRAASRNLQLHPPCWSSSNEAALAGRRLVLPLMYESIEVPGPHPSVRTTVSNPAPGACEDPTPSLFDASEMAVAR